VSIGQETLLVNYWYAHPVGHVIEALRYCLGYKAANPDLHVSVLLNEAAPVELARCCPFLDGVHPVPYTSFLEPDDDPAAALARVPRTWDWVIDNHREREPGHDAFRGFRAFFDASHEHFRPQRGRNWTGSEPPAYVPHRQLRLELPAAARAAAERMLEGRQAISVVLAGSSAERHLYPSVSSWQLILGELSRRHPDAAICLIGKLHADGRTTTRIARAEVDRLLAAVPAALDRFDRPLLEQLAVVEASALFLSPHTGFGFAALAVGTPSLAISGGDWHEMFFNGVPFYSVLPDTERYPCFGWGAPLPLIEADEDGEGPRTASMSAARIRGDLPELLHGAELLIEQRLPYEQALRDYFPRLLSAYKGDRSRVFSFDGIDAAYV
jgi:hypothetical protein